MSSSKKIAKIKLDEDGRKKIKTIFDLLKYKDKLIPMFAAGLINYGFYSHFHKWKKMGGVDTECDNVVMAKYIVKILEDICLIFNEEINEEISKNFQHVKNSIDPNNKDYMKKSDGNFRSL